ncbi:MAG: energy transducer TonB [Pedobacter sp.]|nr:energy transducer TonB [Pedobacter sp.]
MNLRFIIFLVTLLTFSLQSYSQKLDTLFYDVNWKETSKANSSFYRILTKIEEGKFSVTDYFKTGEVQMTGTLKSIAPNVNDGEFIWFYKNGMTQTITSYESGKVITSKSWDEKGKDIVLNGIIDIQPEYRGGMQNFYQYIASHFIYPKGLNPRPKGTINLSFVIDNDGSINDVYVVNSVHPILDAEAVRVLKTMPKWKPGMQKGKAVRVKYNIPLSMK